MERFNILTLAVVASLGLAACGGGNDAVLGSRDDIIILNNGVPMGAAKSSAEVTEEATKEMVKPVSEIEINKAGTDDAVMMAESVVEETEEVVVTEVAETAEEIVEETVPVVTEAQDVDVAPAKQAVETKTEEVVDSVEQTANDVMEDVTEVTMSKPVAAQPMATTPMNSLQPMETTPMKTAEVVDEVVETAPEAPVETTEAKVEGGCYKKTLVMSDMAEDGSVRYITPILEDRRIVCPDKIDGSLIAIVQQALIGRGYNIGAADGKMGDKTHNALDDYQKKNGLGVGGFTYETLTHLNIKAE